MKDTLPKRKHIRLNNYDYSSAGAYFITICTQNRRCCLSNIVEQKNQQDKTVVRTDYTLFGRIAEKQLKNLSKRYSGLAVDSYVIMPNHIHMVLLLNDGFKDNQVSISDVICAYKSLTTREIKKFSTENKVFQTSFYEHIIRNENDYAEIAKYISENPLRWRLDELYMPENGNVKK